MLVFLMWSASTHSYINYWLVQMLFEAVNNLVSKLF